MFHPLSSYSHGFSGPWGPQSRRESRGCIRYRDCQQVQPSYLPKVQCSSLPTPPNLLQRILQLDELGGARELLGSLTFASLGHNTTRSTHIKETEPLKHIRAGTYREAIPTLPFFVRSCLPRGRSDSASSDKE